MPIFDHEVSLAADLAPLVGPPWAQGTHRDVTARLVQLGWTPCGVGDWAVGLRSPSGLLAARVCPFDPAYVAFIDLCRRCAGNPYLPRIERADALDGGGTLTVMEFLAPVEEAVAAAVQRRWTQWAPRADGQPADPAFELVRQVAHQVDAEYRTAMPWWDGIDLNEGNVRRAVDGRVTVIDVFCMDGAALYAQVLADASVVRARMGEEHTRHLLDIPYIARESSPQEIGALRRAWGKG
ncbi:hypothetical protein [Streptomyces zagrosensis]|uniref:Uncharacterized protein n=1 Tax=Streptomyces zagrosensis TaxID=1042984 RepID=A0A7W9Q8V9_9ACTN|nr:hypothetical protein [Streptomyces zagrosensis]MBB5935691.1 hypothetical protein [Streptomyces zagrosensis]